MKVDGCTTACLKLGAVDKDLDMLIVPKLKAETGTKDGFKVPIRYLTPIVSPKRMLSSLDDPGGKNEGDGHSSNERRRQLIAKIAAAVKQSDDVLSDEEVWIGSFDDHSAGVICCENKDDDTIGGCPKAISLEEALQKCRTMSVPETVASVNETATNEDDDSKSLR